RRAQAMEKRRQVELALKQERFEAAHARRQYDAVDPDNRLVASELERRWNDKLIEARRLEDELEAFDTQRQPVLGEQEREHLMRLGADLEIAWSHPAATVATRKRIVRAVLHEIVVRVENDRIEMVLHWQGGDPHAIASQEERDRQKPLDGRRGRRGSGAGTGADDAGPIHCGGSQSRRQTHRPSKRLDAGQSLQIAQKAWCRRLPGRRTRRERRGHFVRNRGGAQYQPDDRAAHDPQWSASCATALQRSALGGQRGGARKRRGARSSAKPTPAQAAT